MWAVNVHYKKLENTNKQKRKKMVTEFWPSAEYLCRDLIKVHVLSGK